MAVTASFLLCSILLIAGLLSAEPQQPQSPLITIFNGASTQQLDLIYELHKAEIIPTVLDEFIPQYTIDATWSEKKNITAAYGNTLPVSATQEAPKIKLTRNQNSQFVSNPRPQLTLIITDPDAPSRDNPEWSEVCHWIVTFPTSRAPTEPNVEIATEGEDVMPYKPPGPPPKTGKHRYVLVALAPLNQTTETLALTPPGERKRWGYERERTGLRRWMGEMGLGVVGANFIYEQDEEQ
ncbi:phosphatidylethanolamine-binding protein [Neohortaea acidophila]|uniref:Phosphatidylethanolamine-binding protein n=1 Tax=Neohortaea acidophila TaxID=245834 RepID=A0A6A6PLY1_9PEZI|nr:phosphatidylethanolamine-binding protein [Neohortaea acidophila]KAF2481108.1 phosphatidylethanolamine-binding protein [Neohortaea acidophila]